MWPSEQGKVERPLRKRVTADSSCLKDALFSYQPEEPTRNRRSGHDEADAVIEVKEVVEVKATPFDKILLRNATLLDGNGDDDLGGSVVIENGVIASVGEVDDEMVENGCFREIDLEGKYITPGFFRFSAAGMSRSTTAVVLDVEVSGGEVEAALEAAEADADKAVNFGFNVVVKEWNRETKESLEAAMKAWNVLGLTLNDQADVSGGQLADLCEFCARQVLVLKVVLGDGNGVAAVDTMEQRAFTTLAFAAEFGVNLVLARRGSNYLVPKGTSVDKWNLLASIRSSNPGSNQAIIDGEDELSAENQEGLQSLVEANSSLPASMFRLRPRKGALAQDSDADLLIWAEDGDNGRLVVTHTVVGGVYLPTGDRAGNSGSLMAKEASGEAAADAEETFQKVERSDPQPAPVAEPRQRPATASYASSYAGSPRITRGSRPGSANAYGVMNQQSTTFSLY